jgi:DASH complex subunit SPC19
VERLERREQALMARAELQAGRLGQGRGQGHGHGKAEGGGRLGEGEESARLRALRLRRERLAYVVERLGLQSQQRERQLRRSVSRAGMDFR